MYDYLISGGLVVDGTGARARHADVAVEHGRIVAIGDLSGAAARKIFDATGLVVAPGFVDVHTHYDAQLHWDGFATPSSQHGVTTVFGGNCGFTLAPLRSRDADYVRRMMAQVEGMPLAALEQGIDWSWQSFGEYLDGLEGGVAVNAGFLVGHCALRTYVMGDDALERESTEDETAAMVQLLAQSIEEGGLGFSTSRSRTHPDHNGNPVPSRQASEREVLALCDEVRRHPGTTLEAITSGCIQGFDDAEVELFAQMSAHAARPLNWNVLNTESAMPGADGDDSRLQRQFAPSRRARELGGRVLALTMPVGAELNMSMSTYCAMWLLPGWREIMSLAPREKTRKLRDPAVRRAMVADAVGSGLEQFADIGQYRIGETVAPENRQYEGRVVADIAAERGVDPWDVMVDIQVADDYRTVLWPVAPEKSQAVWELRRDLWRRDDVLIGGSDAGAHLDRLLASPYPTRFLEFAWREQGLVTLEEAIHLMTDKPARLYGLKDRGRLTEGACADVVVFDPERVRSAGARRAFDLPGDSLRLTADAEGIELVLVNGIESIVGGGATGATAGTVLRSGRDTDTVATR
jgi:N-acyl-D-aspartate/D-glutamate deacylase